MCVIFIFVNATNTSQCDAYFIQENTLFQPSYLHKHTHIHTDLAKLILQRKTTLSGREHNVFEAIKDTLTQVKYVRYYTQNTRVTRHQSLSPTCPPVEYVLSIIPYIFYSNRLKNLKLNIYSKCRTSQCTTSFLLISEQLVKSDTKCV